ncbi:unnamed protein product [Vicia faba]|uniref:Clathrin/coatomer adaptor adaptin-like N-terminal domain-containing protein n=1 Tax=Vicia faba TaxID=3906 RepID=A0AAV0YMY8_VICFA|nr:unnamed protein product [Vicia faba]
MEKSCSLVVHFDKSTPALATEIKEDLEGNDVASKIKALKKAIMLLLNGETIPQLFITVIRHVLTCDDHTVQKLLLLYLEITDKTDSRGKVLPEMILICHNLRNNLQSPNEFIHGVTLRFLCRINESEIVEPLIPSILSNLEHRHPFVRRNVVLAVMSVYKLPQGEQLLDSAPEIVEKFLASEQDPPNRIIDWGEQLQMIVLELIKKVCRNNKGEKELPRRLKEEKKEKLLFLGGSRRVTPNPSPHQKETV